jgi:alkylation response protein AidB-like acyl-CoA dehydrogenase
MTDERPRGDSRHRGPAHASPYALSRLAGPISLVDVAREIEEADQAIAAVATGKLEVIAEQMRALRAKAEQLIQEARESAELHRVEGRFKRVPGKVYHLYARADNGRYWSLLSPEEWGGAPPHSFLGSYRLEADQSFTPLERTAERDALRADLTQALSRKLLGESGS